MATALRSVLVVDDDDEIRDALRDILESTRYRVFVAHSGLDALVVLRSVQVHLVVLDLSMPGMSGWEFLDRRAEHAQFAEVPVIVVTAMHDAQVGDRDVAAVLRKPFTVRAFLDTVARTFGDRDADVGAAGEFDDDVPTSVRRTVIQE